MVDKLDNLPSTIEVKADPTPDIEENEDRTTPPETHLDVVEDRTTELGATDETSAVPQIMPIEDNDLKSTLDALDTAIALKRSAISREKKKRSKIDEGAIAQWEKEIESIARSIDSLKSVSSPGKG